MKERQSGRTIRVGLLTYGLDRPATGIGRYTVEIARALATNHPEIKIHLLQPFSGTIAGLEDFELIRLPGTRLLPSMMSLGAIELVLAARRHRLDIIHDPIGIAPFLFPQNIMPCARIVTIHDMVPFVYPETHARLTNFLFHTYIPRTLRQVDRIVTVSESSKRDIVQYFRFDHDRVHRVYCGVGNRFRPLQPDVIEAVLNRYEIPRPYFLVVGALHARKNIEAVLEAYVDLKNTGLPHRLVIVGPKAWKTEQFFHRLHQLNLESSVLFTGFVADEDPPAIYGGAACFVFPSIYEGFGLPPLEAMACGTPVVASNSSSIPEVMGKAGLLVNPQSKKELSNAILQILTRPDLANDLRQRGFIQSQQFNWETAACQISMLYKEVARPILEHQTQ